MFGDSLLHPECALIVEELKQTSLCFQVSGKDIYTRIERESGACYCC